MDKKSQAFVPKKKREEEKQVQQIKDYESTSFQ